MQSYRKRFSSKSSFNFLFPQEKVSSIPSVVIEPASNNEGEGEEHEVIMNESKDVVEDISTQGTESHTSETSEVVSEQKTIEETQATPSPALPVSVEDAASGMPPGFLFKVYLSIYSYILQISL